MDDTIRSRLKHAWNAFRNRDPTNAYIGYGDYRRPDRPRLTRGNDRSVVTALYSRIALDIAAIDIRHCKVDEEDRFVSFIDSGLNNCLSVEANLDQTGREFIYDAALSMFDDGCVALVPVETTGDPNSGKDYDILSVRVGKILEWFPSKVKIRLYNEWTGKQEELVVSKRVVSIIENPLYSIVNEPNSTIQRLVRKLSLLDATDEHAASNKLNLIIQLPYIIKGETKRNQAEQRMRDIEMQLSSSKYGIAYTDGTERVTQLNRPLENNLMKQVEYLTNMVYSQLGITQSVLDGTADEKTMLNYYNRTLEPIISAIVDGMKRKFLTAEARKDRQTIRFFRDPFRLVPINDLAEIADKFTRNEIMASNEIRQIIGRKPSDDPSADELRNKNISQSKEEIAASIKKQPNETKNPEEGGKNQNE